MVPSLHSPRSVGGLKCAGVGGTFVLKPGYHKRNTAAIARSVSQQHAHHGSATAVSTSEVPVVCDPSEVHSGVSRLVVAEPQPTVEEQPSTSHSRLT